MEAGYFDRKLFKGEREFLEAVAVTKEDAELNYFPYFNKKKLLIIIKQPVEIM